MAADSSSFGTPSSSSNRSLLTLQFGPFANNICSRFWDLQHEQLRVGGLDEIDSSVLYRDGLTAEGIATYTPRALLFDVKGSSAPPLRGAHPRTRHVISSDVLDCFTSGLSVMTDMDTRDEVEDSIRWYLEDTDRLDGFHVFSDTHNGFAGLSKEALLYVREECPKTVVLLFGASPAEYNKEADVATPVAPRSAGRSAGTESALRDVNVGLSWGTFLDRELVTAFVPLSLQSHANIAAAGGTSLFPAPLQPNVLAEDVSAAILASAVDLASMQWRSSVHPGDSAVGARSLVKAPSYGGKALASSEARPGAGGSAAGAGSGAVGPGDDWVWQRKDFSGSGTGTGGGGGGGSSGTRDPHRPYAADAFAGSSQAVGLRLGSAGGGGDTRMKPQDRSRGAPAAAVDVAAAMDDRLVIRPGTAMSSVLGMVSLYAPTSILQLSASFSFDVPTAESPTLASLSPPQMVPLSWAATPVKRRRPSGRAGVTGGSGWPASVFRPDGIARPPFAQLVSVRGLRDSLTTPPPFPDMPESSVVCSSTTVAMSALMRKSGSPYRLAVVASPTVSLPDSPFRAAPNAAVIDCGPSFVPCIQAIGTSYRNLTRGGVGAASHAPVLERFMRDGILGREDLVEAEERLWGAVDSMRFDGDGSESDSD